MIQEWKPDFLTKLYVFSMCLLVYARAEVSWLSAFPEQLLFFFAFGTAFIKIMNKGICANSKKFIWILVWLLYNIVTTVTHDYNINGYLYRFLFFFLISTVILLSVEEMKYLLKAITACFVFILVVSIPAWILYLLGIPLPHTGPHYHPNGFHIYYDYFFFTVNAKFVSSVFSRFSSVFLEPGQMATPCMFLFHLNTKDGKLFQFKNIIMLIGVLMSFSLIGYGLLIVSLVANQMQAIRHRKTMVVLTISILAGLSIYFINHEETAVNALIVSRLEYDEDKGEFSGYNRTTADFDVRFDMMMNSSDKYFGIHDGKNLYWITNTSGYKKYIVCNGIVGLAILMLLMLILLLDNFNRASVVFIIMVVVSFFVRDLLLSPLWLTITIIGMYVLGQTRSTDNTELSYSN